MKVFEVMVLIGVVVLITFGTIMSAAMFESVSLEGNSTHEAETITSHSMVSAWIYVIGCILIVAAIILAFKLFKTA